VSLLIPQSSSSRSCKANPLEFNCVLLLSEGVKLLKNEVKKKRVEIVHRRVRWRRYEKAD
jgi:hypothetical protein